MVDIFLTLTGCLRMATGGPGHKHHKFLILARDLKLWRKRRSHIFVLLRERNESRALDKAGAVPPTGFFYAR